MASTPNERIRQGREKVGLDPAQMAYQVDLSYEAYSDLESFEDEASTVISIRTLRTLARLLGMTPLEILEGEGAAQPVRPLTAAEFSRVVASSVRASGGDIESWGERAGWDVTALVKDPDQVWELNVAGLQEIAEAAGVDWRALLAAEDRSDA